MFFDNDNHSKISELILFSIPGNKQAKEQE